MQEKPEIIGKATNEKTNLSRLCVCVCVCLFVCQQLVECAMEIERTYIHKYICNKLMYICMYEFVAHASFSAV